MFGVFDGHGPYGHDVSDFIAKNLPRIILEAIHTAKDLNMGKVLKDSFKKVHADIDRYSDKTEEFDTALSGTTCTLAVIDNNTNRMWVAHVGDSRSIVCLKDNGKYKAKEITLDHKANLPGELRRIEASGGEVKKVEGDIP